MVHEVALRRVSVYADAAQVDVTLPAAVPIGSLIPPIVDILAARTDHPGPTPARYQLSLPGESALDASQTLAQLGIRDGSILLLTRSFTKLPAPRFDDTAHAVSSSLAAVAPPRTQRAAKVTAALTACGLAGTGGLMLLRNAWFTNEARHVGAAAGVAGAAGCAALVAAAIAHRGFRDATAGLTLGVLAIGFAAVAGLLAVPGGLGPSNVLLAAMAVAAASVLAMRASGCGGVTFTAVACFAGATATAASAAVVTGAPLRVVGAVSTVLSLGLIEASARASMRLAGLSPRLALKAVDEPTWAPDRLPAKATRAAGWLTGLLAAFSASAALGAIATAAGSYSSARPPVAGCAFAVLTAAVLLLRARSQVDVARTVPLVVGGTATLGATFVVGAASFPHQVAWIAAATATLTAVALCVGFIAPLMTFSPAPRRSTELAEYVALAAIVLLACGICNLYGAARGVHLS
jgi:type VII secretion integral membrane protein EccD